jgi:hypothetical protein
MMGAGDDDDGQYIILWHRIYIAGRRPRAVAILRRGAEAILTNKKRGDNLCKNKTNMTWKSLSKSETLGINIYEIGPPLPPRTCTNKTRTKQYKKVRVGLGWVPEEVERKFGYVIENLLAR